MLSRGPIGRVEFVGATIVVAIILFAWTAVAQTPGRDSRGVFIDQVFVTIGDGACNGEDSITIVGGNFDRRAAVEVFLGDDPTALFLCSTSATEIVAQLPDVPDGDFRVRVVTGKSALDFEVK